DDPSANPIWAADQGSCTARFSFTGKASGPGSRNPEHLRLTGNAPQSGYLVLRLLAFPAWLAEFNGQTLTNDRANALHTRPDGLIAIPVQRGPINLSLDWTTTPDVILGRVVSVISIALAALLAWFERRQQ
ncbi:MAG: hypothetical protein WBE74_00050, partial [Terracidiphilus sp.]